MGNSTDKSSPRSSVDMQKSSNSITPLYEACRDGNEELVRQFLSKYSHVDLNRQEYPYGGNTCLHIAAASGHDNIVKLLLEHGCYRSSLLNAQNQSAYDVASATKESIRSLFLRQDCNDPSPKSASRFHDQNATECFDIVQLEESSKNEENPSEKRRASNVQAFKTEEEKVHELEYSASSKAMCQSRLGRFFVNRFHDDEPLDQGTIVERLNNLLQIMRSHDSGDYIKVDDLFKKFEHNCDSIEELLHLYTLETDFYTMLKQDCLPLAIPLFINLSTLKERYFKGRVYRGMKMTHEQILTYQIAMETSGTVLQTRSFSSTSIDRLIAEQFAYLKSEKSGDKLSVLYIFDFPDICDQAINLSRISHDKPCLSEYEDEQEVLILPWTLFEVTRVRKATHDDELSTIHLTNVIIPKKNLLSTFKWSLVEIKNQIKKEKKVKFNCAFQQYKT